MQPLAVAGGTGAPSEILGDAEVDDLHDVTIGDASNEDVPPV